MFLLCQNIHHTFLPQLQVPQLENQSIIDTFIFLGSYDLRNDILEVLLSRRIAFFMFEELTVFFRAVEAMKMKDIWLITAFWHALRFELVFEGIEEIVEALRWAWTDWKVKMFSLLLKTT